MKLLFELILVLAAVSTGPAFGLRIIPQQVSSKLAGTIGVGKSLVGSAINTGAGLVSNTFEAGTNAAENVVSSGTDLISNTVGSVIDTGTNIVDRSINRVRGVALISAQTVVEKLLPSSVKDFFFDMVIMSLRNLLRVAAPRVYLVLETATNILNWLSKSDKIVDTLRLILDENILNTLGDILNFLNKFFNL